MDGKSAADILQDLLAEARRLALDPDRYPQNVLQDSEQYVFSWDRGGDPRIVELMQQYGDDLLFHTLVYTINWLHGVEQQMFFTDAGRTLLGYGPWLALRMFALGCYAGMTGNDMTPLLSGEEMKRFWGELLEMYTDVELYVDSTMTVMEVDNPFVGDTLEEQ